jgi:hypothetical protein
MVQDLAAPREARCSAMGQRRKQAMSSAQCAGTLNVLDGTTSLMLIPAPVTGATDINPRYFEIGCVAQSTKGFNVTSGSSVSCVAFGRFS